MEEKKKKGKYGRKVDSGKKSEQIEEKKPGADENFWGFCE